MSVPRHSTPSLIHLLCVLHSFLLIRIKWIELGLAAAVAEATDFTSQMMGNFMSLKERSPVGTHGIPER
ncbi:uncharacterized protein PG986_008216 [Apiospora aurea]|uniref:Uncharacterized protein n=1 Tax=Apiospora aurea TaxID=335848 RepID=A0ABR1QF52_9PEZI